jgi:alpha-D-ribose 1-methylphosphonate 5-phosphate C-P lyase
MYMICCWRCTTLTEKIIVIKWRRLMDVVNKKVIHIFSIATPEPMELILPTSAKAYHHHSLSKTPKTDKEIDGRKYE